MGMNLRFIGILLAVSMLGFSWIYEALAYGIATERCRESTTYGPADSVIYRPGLDIKGRAVVPADLGSNKGISIPSDIDIEIIINFLVKVTMQLVILLMKEKILRDLN